MSERNELTIRMGMPVFVVVPAQVQSLVGPAAKGRWLGGVVACGAGTCKVDSWYNCVSTPLCTFRVATPMYEAPTHGEKKRQQLYCYKTKTTP